MSDSQDTIFDKILDGEIPCYRVYEDDHVLAFLDVGPLSRGHTLVIPKERKAFVHELSDPSAQIGSPGSLSPTILSSICAVFTKKVLLSWPSSPMGGHFSYGHEVANRTLIIKILSFQI